MANTVWGVLGLQDVDLTVEQVGQAVVYDAVNQLAEAHNQEMQQMISLFVEEDTTDYKEVYKLPGGGMMQESDELTRPGAIKGGSEYEVAYDLRDARDQVAWDDVSIAYLSLAELNRVLQTVFIRHTNWVRYHLFRHLLNKTNEIFIDKLRGSLTIRRLANQDGTLYAPTQAGGDPAEDNHYLVSGYDAASISDANNPFPILRDEIEEHFGTGNLLAFINNAQSAAVKALTNFIEVADPAIRPGANQDVLVGGPGVSFPGTLIGRIDQTWVVEWRNWPANYIGMIDLNQPAPLKRRLDTPATIAGRGGLALVAQQTEIPFIGSFWRDRHGYGVGNRLSMAIMELTTNGSYTTPAAYA